MNPLHRPRLRIADLPVTVLSIHDEPPEPPEAVVDRVSRDRRLARELSRLVSIQFKILGVLATQRTAMALSHLQFLHGVSGPYPLIRQALEALVAEGSVVRTFREVAFRSGPVAYYQLTRHAEAEADAQVESGVGR